MATIAEQRSSLVRCSTPARRSSTPAFTKHLSIAESVIQEDADVLGLSILSGAHMTLVLRVLELLEQQRVGTSL